MAGKFATRTALSTFALAVALTGSTFPASAEQYLLDMLFGGNHANQQQVERPQVQRTPKPTRQATRPAPVAIAKVSSPSYYNYQPESLVSVDFATLSASLPNRAAGEGGTASSAFLEALAHLSEYELQAEKQVAAALIEHYTANAEFIWVDENGPTERAKDVVGVLNRAAEFGLLETDYVVRLPVSTVRPSDDRNERLAALARFEMTLTARVLRYARDANLGRVDPNKLSGYHDFPAKPLQERTVLEVLAGSPRPDRYLESLHPQNELYAALRAELKSLRASDELEIVVDSETLVRPGESNREFPKILRIIERDADAAFRAEHGEILAAHRGSETYARELVPVIKAAQQTHDLNPDGVIGRRTIGALVGETKAARIEKVLLAMERLRWHPSRLGRTRVMINAASFTADYVENNVEKLSMRVVVGSRSNQTNFFHDEIEYVEFNPYWGVPRSILVNEKLPRLRRDPGYLDRTGYEVTDARGRRISSSSINWNRYGANVPFNVRQKPGPSNALGQLKIMFPNKHDIYMHDTPEKSLFSRDTRAFSHGCVRLHDPRAMAAAVLGVSVEEVGSRISAGRNARQNVQQKIPVYVGYFTAWPESGGVSYHPDIYDRDSHLAKALTKVEETRAAGS